MKENLEPTASDPREIDEVSRPAERESARSPERILSAVGNEHRRAILESLNRASNQILEFDTLVDRVADRIQDEHPTRASDEHRHRIRIALHHTHLPELEAVRIVDYETETGQVEFVGGELEQDLLTLVGNHDGNE